MKLYNTLTRQEEDFTPQSDEVKMYVCGITPYADSHVGHAMSHIIFDVFRRYLEWRGYKVKHVQNFTDVEDKIIQRANAIGEDPQTLTNGLIAAYFEEMDALNIQRAHVYPRATEEIPAIIQMVQGLMDKGYAYNVNGDVFFRVKGYPDYGQLSHRNLEGMTVRARIETDFRKEHPMDFALWKAAKPAEPAWDSPWGAGRPGWHIECSAMSYKYLGATLDIHGGGQDLIFPHHENEIAQTEAYTGVKPFVRHWLHHGLLQLEEEKMSKSLGNLVTVKEVLSQYSSDALRLFVLSSHYRSPLTYSDEALQSMDRGAERLRNAAGQGEAETRGHLLSPKSYKQRFIEAMENNFNTPQAVAALFDLAKEINRASNEGLNIGEAVQVLRELARTLGLTLKEPEIRLDPGPFKELLTSLNGAISRIQLDQATSRQVDSLLEQAANAESIIDVLLSVRTQLRMARRFDLADKIRSELSNLGIALEDTPRGTLWKRKSFSEG